jgi:hypothetical protein
LKYFWQAINSADKRSMDAENVECQRFSDYRNDDVENLYYNNKLGTFYVWFEKHEVGKFPEVLVVN